jgi:hypothetical protein
MYENAAVGHGKCCDGILIEGKIKGALKQDCARKCIAGKKGQGKIKQCADWHKGKKEEALFGNLFGEDAAFGGRRRRASRRRRAGFFKKVIKRVKKVAHKVKKAAKKTAKKGAAIAKKTVKKGIAIAKKTVKTGLSGAMGKILKMVLSKLPKSIRPFISNAVSTYMKTKSLTKTLMKVLPLAMEPVLKLVPAKFRAIVKTGINTFLATKSFGATVQAMMASKEVKISLNWFLTKYVSRKIWLKLGTNPCSIECLCHSVLDPFLHQKMTTKATISRESWSQAKKMTQEAQFLEESKKFDFKSRQYPDQHTLVFTRRATIDIPATEMENWKNGKRKGTKKGETLCQARFNVLTAVCRSCCCPQGKIYAKVGSAMSIQNAAACTGWFQLLDQAMRATVNIAATVYGVDTQNRCMSHFHDLKLKHGLIGINSGFGAHRN